VKGRLGGLGRSAMLLERASQDLLPSSDLLGGIVAVNRIRSSSCLDCRSPLMPVNGYKTLTHCSELLPLGDLFLEESFLLFGASRWGFRLDLLQYVAKRLEDRSRA